MPKGRFIVDRYDHKGNSLSRAEQSRAEQSRAEQSRAEQSRAEAIINCAFFASYSSGTLENVYYIDDG